MQVFERMRTHSSTRMPAAARPMYVATTDVIPNGMSVREFDAGSISSMAKTTPPIGVLNVAAIPPAAPQAIRVTRCETLQPDATPTIEPKVDPI